MQHDVLIRRSIAVMTLTCLAAAAMVASSAGLLGYSSSIAPGECGVETAHGPFIEPSGYGPFIEPSGPWRILGQS